MSPDLLSTPIRSGSVEGTLDQRRGFTSGDEESGGGECDPCLESSGVERGTNTRRIIVARSLTTTPVARGSGREAWCYLANLTCRAGGHTVWVFSGPEPFKPFLLKRSVKE